MQIHAGGLRHIRTDRRINEWRAPGRKNITCATSNNRQVVIACQGVFQ
jgi:splicing factor 3B subunit 3